MDTLRMSGLFGTNPLSTQIGQLIDRATDVNVSEESLQIYYEIADLIDEKEENAKDAVKAIKKKLSIYGGRNWSVVTKLLNLLELCATNCNRRFHLQLAQKDFLQDLKNLIGPKLQPPQLIQEKVLNLIQTWANLFKNDAELKQIEIFYNDLRSKGIDFPVVDPNQGVLALSLPQPLSSNDSTSSTTTQVDSLSRQQSTARSPTRPQPPMQQQPKSIPVNVNTVVTLTPEQAGKLNSELDVVESNVQVFNEVLNHLQNVNITKLHGDYKSDIALLRDLNRTCNEMQTRVTQLITSITNENIIDELLRINDDLNNIFLRYERFENSLPQGVSNVSPQAAAAAPTAQRTTPTAAPNLNVYSRNMRSGGGAAAAATMSEEKPLIDFGDDSNDNLTTNTGRLSLQSSNANAMQRPQARQASHTTSGRPENEDRNAFLKDENEIQEMENWLRSQGDDTVDGQNEFDNYVQPKNEVRPSTTNNNNNTNNRQVKTETKSQFSL